MAKRKDNGLGTIYERAPGKFVGRLMIGTDTNGKPKFKYFSGKTETEVKKKIREFNRSGCQLITGTATVKTYTDTWLQTYKRPKLKSSSYDRIENTIKHQIIPEIGMIQMREVTSDDIQNMLTVLKDQGLSYSTVKKAYDCMKAVMRHAAAKGDIIRDPMLIVEMPGEATFESSEMRIFNEKEALRIVEECKRMTTNNRPAHYYGDAFILMLNTGLRVGEALGLRKTDWNKEDKTLHVGRNVQCIKKRNKDGSITKGFELRSMTTKTYSGERTIPLNLAAQEALERLCGRKTSGETLINSNRGTDIPPHRLERAFYTVLDKAEVERCGIHTLRHTFASILFKNKVDIKTISKLLGHSSVQITIDTYIHLIDGISHEAVETLDNTFRT